MADLIVFFSRRDENYVNGTIKNIEAGNTEAAARIIQEFTGAALFQIEPEAEYSKIYSECTAQAKADLENNARPPLKRYPAAWESYDTVYLGYPNYWGTMPMAVFTFLEGMDFSGKIIRPFCTHEGSGLGNSIPDIERLCPGADIKEGLAIEGSTVKGAGENIVKWITEG